MSDESDSILNFIEWGTTPIVNIKGVVSAAPSVLQSEVKQIAPIQQGNQHSDQSVVNTSFQPQSCSAQCMSAQDNLYQAALSGQYGGYALEPGLFTSAQNNRMGFIKSFRYFNRLVSGMPDEPSLSNYSDSVLDPMMRRSKQPNVAKGLFCSNRECCSLILDLQGRSPYCSKQCQIREQNMRQGRVKFRESLIRRKEALFSYLARIEEPDFDRARLVEIVGVFLQEYAKEFGDF